MNKYWLVMRDLFFCMTLCLGIEKTDPDYYILFYRSISCSLLFTNGNVFHLTVDNNYNSWRSCLPLVEALSGRCAILEYFTHFLFIYWHRANIVMDQWCKTGYNRSKFEYNIPAYVHSKIGLQDSFLHFQSNQEKGLISVAQQYCLWPLSIDIDIHW